MGVLSSILENKIVAIIRNIHPDNVEDIANALYEGGIRIVEITLNSPKALSVIENLSEDLGEKMVIGAGTVLDPESARDALSAGAKFILSPTVNTETIKITKRYGAVSIPGAFTPTEILTAYESGGDIIKVFPANFGLGYIKAVKGPLPHIPLLPTGGINLKNAREYIDNGAVGIGVGGSLVDSKSEVNETYLTELTNKSRQYVNVVHGK
ncbi:bifunctional 4-hydroxy-2-oxoglutarate aldolase/2-dehydro-3-deoxy-phosphogluconate aldolase [Lederbergia citri]|uniref:Bifunctional 4-hydroxy-2-oxoglutarate aldolase/2-dehydro-3-deoxy-phosphogluconate aldolase n=1 Tax=Lederbergia citri TaxID=2833580 RepID=A0A942TKL3_9BACI|nr:bifunctional 4-hydroxy-2-oxoglutarate aldolase/2-dehydro-3-deoxy-phosphogluconate aldolase [Lederbergia citri]MBS4197752.1 bifunctional 4-hydroxy-2-oxoglutarate aldolase/2-dehydro-3-deoxy-phosphogluconate aldolase [Lederbergia citri]